MEQQLELQAQDIDSAFIIGRAKVLTDKLRANLKEDNLREAKHLMEQAAFQIEIMREEIIFLLNENRELYNETVIYGQ